MQFDRYASVSSRLITSACVAVAVTVMAAWLTRSDDLAQSVPRLFSMQFNTALCFLLTACAFHLAVPGTRYRTTAIGLAGGAILFGFLTLCQHGLGLDLGIDRLFVTPFVSIGADQPGRMAPNAAICFMLVGAAIILTVVQKRNSLLRAALALIVFMIAGSALIGYAVDLEAAPVWRPLAQMAPPTAFCFSLLAGGLIFIGSLGKGYSRPVIAAGLGALTYFLLVLVAYLEMTAHDQRLEAFLGESGLHPHSTLLGVVLLSGTIYAAFIVYAFRNSQRYKDLAQQLQESQRRLSAIIETAVDGFITIDGRGTILAINPACERIFGYRADEMLGRNVKMLMPAPYHDAHDQYLANYHETGNAKIIGIGREVEGRRKDGTTFPLDLAVAKVTLDRQVLYSGIVRDISERKKNQREILEANAELEEFSYRTSHDLRSPIASSLGLLGIAREMIAEGDTRQALSVLGRVETSFRKLDHLIQNIILLTRAKALEETETEIPVAHTVRETLERLHYMEHADRLQIDIAIDETLTTRLKASRFQIIIDNLLSNAIKYQDPAQHAPRIRIAAQRRDSRLVFSVADNGLGIKPGDERQLFQMFKRLHPQHSFGSGLGLYILKKSVDHLGGTIAYRRLEDGSLFTVTLPEGQNHAH